MYKIVITLLTAIVILSPLRAPAANGDNPAETAARRDMSQAEARRVYELLFTGLSGSARAFVDSLGAVCEGEPLYLLMRARVAREWLVVDDDSKEILKQQAEVIYRDLERVVDVCSRRIDDDAPNETELRMMRGWAWMLKAHIRTFERSYWKAGREAKKGKDDLEHYLRAHPNDGNAASILGTFLYFADQISVVVKFISKLLFMPSGDRVEGLRLMQAGAANPESPPDSPILLHSINVMFEGKWESGLAGFDAMMEDYPNYMALARAFVLMAPLAPEHAHEFSVKVSRVAAFVDEQPSYEVIPASRELLRFQMAYADRFYAPDRAMVELDDIALAAAPHPDWVAGYAAFEKGRMLAARAEGAAASEYFGWVLANSHVSYLHDAARKSLEQLEEETVTPPLLHPSTIGRIYRGDGEARQRIIDAVNAVDAPSIHDLFYLGDALLLHGRLDEALSVYEQISDVDAPVWDHPYQMLAAGRAAEVYGLHGDYETAADRLDRAMKFYHYEFLYDWVIEGRKRYYERLHDGELTETPTLFSSRR